MTHRLDLPFTSFKSSLSVGALGLALAAACLAPATASAQTSPEPRAWNAVYAELGGAGFIGSVNYEIRPVPWFGARAGALWIPDDSGQLTLLSSLFGFVGTGESLLELGAGPSIFPHGDSTGVLIHLSVGYRYQSRTLGELFRVAWTPLLNPKDRPFFGILGPRHLWTWAGLSAGLVF